jgi:hypothetical protein
MNRSRTITLVSSLIIVLFIAFSACKKQEIQGPKGENGTNGVGGNANITSTNTFVVNQAAWVEDIPTGTQNVTLNFPELTQAVVDQGTVKVYKLNGTVWSELPFDQGDILTQYGFDVGHLYLNAINIEGSPPPTAPLTARYRLVIIAKI